MPEITREFVNGVMKVTFPNGKTRDVTVEQLEARLVNMGNMFANREAQLDKRIADVTAKIAEEENEEKKARMQKRLEMMQDRKANLPTLEERQSEIQGWIDSAKASA